MNINDLKEYCMSKKGTSIDFPFDDRTMVFKIGSKMYALTDIKVADESEQRINLKCNPDLALDLRENFEAVIPGYHMNKKHWNTIYINKDMPQKQLFEMIDHSYSLIFKSLKKSEKEKILKL